MNTQERYSRQTMLPQVGTVGQQHLAEASVLIVGLGGLGAPVAQYLTGAGVGRIGLCDPDIVSESNLQRQVLYETAMVGEPKVECARRRLAALSPHTVFELYPGGLTDENSEEIVSGYDLVVDCCDNFTTRYFIDDTCYRLGKPWIYGSIGEFMGQVAVMNGIAGRRYIDLYPDREELCDRPPVVRGVLGPVPGVIGAIEASEALKLIVSTGEPLDGKLFVIDLLTLSTSLIEF